MKRNTRTAKPDFKFDDDVLVDVGKGRTRAAWCIDVVPCVVVRWYTKNGNLRKGCAYVPIEKVTKKEQTK